MIFVVLSPFVIFVLRFLRICIKNLLNLYLRISFKIGDREVFLSPPLVLLPFCSAWGDPLVWKG